MIALRFTITCVACTGQEDYEALLALEDSARDITRRTFLKHVDREDLRQLEEDRGYATHPGQGLTMAGDFHVRYYKGLWKGRPAYCFDWSSIDHVFADDATPDQGEED